MRKAIHEISDNLNRMKGFEAGYTTSNNKEMLITLKNKVYKITIEELEDANNGLEIEHIQQYL